MAVDTTKLASAWRSSRLIYRAVEDNEEDRSFLSQHLDNDPSSVPMTQMRACAPAPRTAQDRYYQGLGPACLLRVFICLPPSSDRQEVINRMAAGDPELEGLNENEAYEFEQGQINHAYLHSERPISAKQKSKLTPIGTITLFQKGGEIAAHHRCAFLGVTVIWDYRGAGYGREAIDWALDWGFLRGGLHRIELEAASYNETALKLYRKLGFVEEGRAREAIRFERKWYDLVSMGILEQEWEALREEAREKEEREMEESG